MEASSRVDYEPSTKSLVITLTVISLLYESLFLDSLSLECWHFFLIIKVPILTNRVPLLNHGWSKDGFFFVQLWMCTITSFTANKAYTQLWVKLTWEFFFFFLGSTYEKWTCVLTIEMMLYSWLTKITKVILRPSTETLASLSSRWKIKIEVKLLFIIFFT